MKIIRVDAWEVPIALEESYAIAYASVEHAVNIFLRLETDSGIIGYGCANPDPEVTGETPAGVQAALVEVGEGILRGADALHRMAILRDLESSLPTQPSARAAIDMALHDILGKAAGLPVWKLLGGFRDRIRTDVTLGIMPAEAAARSALHWVERGVTCLKVKGGRDVEEDIRRVWAIRNAVGEAIELRFDANQGFALDSTVYFARETRPAGIAFIEQPTPKHDFVLLGEVSRAIDIPVMADESVLDSRDALTLAQQGLVRMLNIKLMKTGGLMEALRVAAVAEAAGLQTMIGCMDESLLGIAAGLHFACACPTVGLADLDGHLGMIDDPARSGLEFSDGVLYPLSDPGFGVEVQGPR